LQAQPSFTYSSRSRAGCRRSTVSAYRTQTSAPSAAKTFLAANIKGNINEWGERIYHMPGQKYYSETGISLARGERWFCSQWEAWWAGWRKAKV
jgi:hypothetical protein